MVEVVREFIVKEEAGSRFELAYGPGGAWSKLLARRPGFRGITVMRDLTDPRRYLTIELWETEVQREQALSACKAEYSELEVFLDSWTETRNELGVFSVRPKATVRPFGPVKPGKTGKTRRKNW